MNSSSEEYCFIIVIAAYSVTALSDHEAYSELN